MKGDGVKPSAFGITLRDNRSDGVVRGVCFQDRRERWIEVSQNRGCGEGGMKRIECGLSLQGPFEPSVLTQQFCDECSDFTEIVNEMTVEIGEAQKNSYVMNGLGN